MPSRFHFCRNMGKNVEIAKQETFQNKLILGSFLLKEAKMNRFL